MFKYKDDSQDNEELENTNSSNNSSNITKENNKIKIHYS